LFDWTLVQPETCLTGNLFSWKFVQPNTCSTKDLSDQTLKRDLSD
jgi:hypothetical protein